MYKVIILIATTVIAINLLYTMLPGGNYEKYCKYIFGVVLVLIFAGTIAKFDISSQVLDFEDNVPVFENTKITETVQKNTEKLISENIVNMLKVNRLSVKNVEVILENNELINVKVSLSDEENKGKIISLISSYCDINIDAVVVE